MEKRLGNNGYLMALGHNAIATREGRRVDNCHALDLFDVDPIATGVDLCAVRMALGTKSPEGWLDHCADEETFTSGMTTGVKALILGYLWENTVPSDWHDCLDCNDGCDRCNGLGIVPLEMIDRCPACYGDDCSRCLDGECWASEVDDIRDDVITGADVYRTEHEQMGDI